MRLSSKCIAINLFNKILADVQVDCDMDMKRESRSMLWYAPSKATWLR